MKMKKTLKTVATLGILAAIAGATVWYQSTTTSDTPDNVASGNGRIEATEYDIATKNPGQLEALMVREGDMVEKGEVLAHMDTRSLDAQLREAQAGLKEARENREYAQAIVQVRESEVSYAEREFQRLDKLARSGHVSQEQFDQAGTQLEIARANLTAARVDVTRAESGIEAAEAKVARLESDHEDSRLAAPVGGRVLYKLADPGEVLGAGGKVLTVLDLTDVYMTFFLPTEQAGKVRIGDEARLILDAIPQYVIPANISFVAPRAQFTPKAVETRSEREKLMFRVKARVDPSLLKQHIEAVKTGVPGEAFVRVDPDSPWPDSLKVSLPE